MPIISVIGKCGGEDEIIERPQGRVDGLVARAIFPRARERCMDTMDTCMDTMGYYGYYG